MAVVTKKVQYLYEDYNLYAATYSRRPSYKLGEALAALFSMSHLKSLRPNAFQPFNVLEILAGRGEHERFMRQYAGPLPVGTYHTLDSVAAPDSSANTLVGNALTVSVDPTININFIIGFFYTASTVTDLDGTHKHPHARSVLLQLYQNMYNNLPDLGAFSIDFVNSGYENSLYASAPESEEEYDVPFYHPLRVEYGLPTWGVCTVKFSRIAHYDRLTSTCYDTFTSQFVVTYNDRVVARTRVAKPLTQRYFSETELMDVAQEAGFSRVDLFSNNYTENFYYLLNPTIQLVEGEEVTESNLSEHTGNTMLAIKGL